LAKLKEGVAAWNKWRRENRGVRIDLRSAQLSHADLTHADFSRADLSRANLTGSIVVATVFGDTLLAGGKGLDACRHFGPSTIDLRTLARSGLLPERFLRGCGLPDDFIAYLPSLLAQPIQLHSCFISYSSKDNDFAERLHADLQSKGVRCWFAPEDLKTGDKLRPVVDQSIWVYDKLMVILSQHSVTSNWVEHEVETALAREQKQKRTILFPIRLDDTVMEITTGWPAHIRNTRHIGDFREWKNHDTYQKSFDRLLRDLKKDDKKPADG
jgi:hypothetical protein